MQNIDETSIGLNLKRIRNEKGLTQQQISTATGIQNTVISAYENGKKTPGLATLISIAQALNVSIDELVFGTPAEKIIISSKDKAEIIVRCIYELWKMGMIMPPYVIQQLLKAYCSGHEYDLYGVWQFNYSLIIDRLLNQLNDHKANSETYSNPEKHIEQILESAIYDINKYLK